MKDIYKNLAFLACVPLIILYGCWAWAVVCLDAFTWLVHPIFPMLAEPTLIQFACMRVFMVVFLPTSPNKSKNEDSIGIDIWFALFLPWSMWLVVWFIHLVFVPGVYTP